MPVRFLRNASELADVSWETPLPVQVANAKPVPADTLLVATTTVTTDANRDLLGKAPAPNCRRWMGADSTVNSSGSTSARAETRHHLPRSRTRDRP
jgi:hypothetical protein